MTRLGGQNRLGRKWSPNKYGAVKTTVDGMVFDSKAEARYYSELELLKRSGDIQWFNRQPSFLLPGGVRYRPDFIVCDRSGQIYVIDVKGCPTAAFSIKAKIFQEQYPTLELKIVY